MKDVTEQTKRDPAQTAVLYPFARGQLEVSKADGSETLVVDRVRMVARKGGAKCGSLAEFDALEQRKAGWPNGRGLLLSPSSFRSLRKECVPSAPSPSKPDVEPEG